MVHWVRFREANLSSKIVDKPEQAGGGEGGAEFGGSTSAAFLVKPPFAPDQLGRGVHDSQLITLVLLVLLLHQAIVDMVRSLL